MKINVRDTGKLKPRQMPPDIEINNDMEEKTHQAQTRKMVLCKKVRE